MQILLHWLINPAIDIAGHANLPASGEQGETIDRLGCNAVNRPQVNLTIDDFIDSVTVEPEDSPAE